MTLLVDLVATSAAVGATGSRSAKAELLAGLLAQLDTTEIEPAVGFLTGTPRQGRVGVGWAGAATIDGRAAVPTLTIGELDTLLDNLAATDGPGSQAARSALLAELSDRATPEEGRFVRQLLTGELRQGALAGVMADAVAKAASVPATAVRRAAMLTGDLGRTALLARTGGRAALEGTRLTVGTAVQPMLATTAADPADALATTGAASVEWKLDGVRLQAHRAGDQVRLFTRNLNDITAHLPGVAAEILALPHDRLVLDGEVLGIDEEGAPLLFQDSMSTVGAEDRTRHRLVASWFDLLALDGDDLLDRPLAERLDALGSIGSLRRIPATRTDDPAVAGAVLEQALAAGHEGIMIKSLDAPYQAGRRGKAWRKVKPVHTLDLVVLAVEWGSGRRQGWLSNLHLGALGPDGTPVMVGKTFKGLTDELLAWQTERFLQLETHRDRHVVWVRPTQVVEIALDGAQRSSRYPGGVALRFARVRRYRDDKTAEQADTLDAVRALLPRR